MPPFALSSSRHLGRAAAGAIASLLLLLGACGGDADSETSAPSPAPTVQATTAPVQDQPTATSVPEPTATIAPTPTSAAPTEPAPPATATAVPTPTPDPVSCVLLEDFADGAADRWRVVNDGVMGGLSAGSVSFDDGAMTFSGVINTNGGGFSSVRFNLPLGGLPDATELRLGVRSDGRSYELLADDTLGGRDRRVTHYQTIPASNPGQWATVVVPFAGMEARVFGTPINEPGFVPELAVTIGVILADGFDGPFELMLDTVEACAT